VASDGWQWEVKRDTSLRGLCSEWRSFFVGEGFEIWGSCGHGRSGAATLRRGEKAGPSLRSG
jgi:hypothetical protein